MFMLRDLLKGLADLVYPKRCVVCKCTIAKKATIDEVICWECWNKIKKNTPPFCHCCGRVLKKNSFAKHICPECVRKKFHFDRAYSPCIYDGAIKELIHEFKYNGKDYLGNTLSKLMINFIKEYDLPVEYIDFIVPVPLHKSRLREREFNQSQILSKHIASEFNKPLLADTLIRHRQTRTQTELDTEKRLTNVEGSFRVENKEIVRGKNILLIDDVLTTAATSSEAAFTLKSSGAGIVFVLTLAN